MDQFPDWFVLGATLVFCALSFSLILALSCWCVALAISYFLKTRKLVQDFIAFMLERKHEEERIRKMCERESEFISKVPGIRKRR